MYDWIDNVIEGLKESYETTDIYDLCDALSIKIIKLENTNILLRGNESLYNRDYLENEIIFIRDDLDRKYERFVLAHELGHALLHTHISEAAFNSLLNKGKLEKQANYFALKLSNLNFDPLQFQDFTIKQIFSSLYLPNDILNIVSEMR